MRGEPLIDGDQATADSFSRGRVATMKAYALLGRAPKVTPPPDGQRGLFDVIG